MSLIRNIPLKWALMFLLVVTMLPTTLLVSYRGAQALILMFEQQHLQVESHKLALKMRAVTDYIDEVANDTLTIAQEVGVKRFFAQQIGGASTMSPQTAAFLDATFDTKNYLNFYFLSPQGTINYANRHSERWVGKNVFELNFSKDTMAELNDEKIRLPPNDVAILDIFSPNDDQYIGLFLAKVHDHNGRVLGYVITTVDADGVGDALSVGAEVDQSRITYIFAERNGQMSLVTPVDRWDGGNYKSGFVPETLPQYWIDAVNTGAAGGQGAYQSEGGFEALVVFKKLTGIELKWYAVSLALEQNVFQNFYSAMGTTLLFGGVICTAVLLLFYFSANVFVQRLNMAAAFANRVKRKPYGQRLYVSRVSELASLNSSMNSMASQLSQDNWNNSGRLRLEEAVRSANDLQQLGDAVLGFFVGYTQLYAGAVYLYDKASGHLDLGSHYHYTPVKTRYQLGESVVGQTMKDKTAHFTGRTAVNLAGIKARMAGSQQQGSSLVVPIYSAQRDFGVLVLSFGFQLTPTMKQFILSLMPMISVTYSEKYRGARITALLDAAQQTQTQLTATNSELTSLSDIDDLTAMYNKRKGQVLLREAWDKAQRLSQPLSIIVFDIDHFKQYNDSFGHAQGDVCLRNVAEAVQSLTLSDGDFFSRIGGEEFVLILPNADRDRANIMANAIREKVQALGIVHSDKVAWQHVTVSVGTSTSSPHQHDKMDDAFQRADDNLYKAKRGGRNRVWAE